MAGPELILIRGQAYLEAGQPQLAEPEFRYVLDHSSAGLGLWEAIARLGLARALTRKGDHANGRSAYEAVFAQWKDADPDLPLLLKAQKEYGEIGVEPTHEPRLQR